MFGVYRVRDLEVRSGWKGFRISLGMLRVCTVKDLEVRNGSKLSRSAVLMELFACLSGSML